MAEIREAGAGDMEGVRKIYAHYVRTSLATFETEPPTASEMERRWSDLLSRGLPYLISELDGVLVGYAYATPYRARYAYRYSVENSVYVHPDYMRKGIGRTLLETLIRQCELRGFRQMVAVIGDSANVASIGLHERLGFRRVGVLEAVGFKFERWVDTVLMQRALG